MIFPSMFGDRVFVLAVMIHAFDDLPVDWDGSIDHRMGDPTTRATIVVDGHRYDVTIKGAD